jgi:hypothetical protein
MRRWQCAQPSFETPASRAPQDEAVDRAGSRRPGNDEAICSIPHGEERGAAALLEPCVAGSACQHPSRRPLHRLLRMREDGPLRGLLRMRKWTEVTKPLLPRETGEGDHAQHGGGGSGPARSAAYMRIIGRTSLIRSDTLVERSPPPLFERFPSPAERGGG